MHRAERAASAGSTTLSALIRVAGKDLNVEDLLERVQLDPDRVTKKSPNSREASSREREARDFITFYIEGTDLQPLQEQLPLIIQYLRTNQEQLRFLASEPSVEESVLAIGIAIPECAVSFTDRLPSELLKLVSALGFSLEISHYLSSD